MKPLKDGDTVMTASKSLMVGFGISMLLGASAIVAGATYLSPALADDDIGTLTPEKAAKVFPAKPNYSPYAVAVFRRGRSSATRTCTRPPPSMPVPLARGSRRAKPTGWREARKSRPRAGSR